MAVRSACTRPVGSGGMSPQSGNGAVCTDKRRPQLVSVCLISPPVGHVEGGTRNIHAVPLSRVLIDDKTILEPCQGPDLHPESPAKGSADRDIMTAARSWSAGATPLPAYQGSGRPRSVVRSGPPIGSTEPAAGQCCRDGSAIFSTPKDWSRSGSISCPVGNFGHKYEHSPWSVTFSRRGWPCGRPSSRSSAQAFLDMLGQQAE